METWLVGGGVILAAAVAVWVFGLWYFREWIAHNDFAIFRIRLEHLLDGDVALVGAYSRLGVHHPGPLYEWVFVGPYLLSGRRAAALPATALLVNLSWCAVVLYAAWCRRSRWISPTIVAGLVLVVVAMRNQLDSPWHPHLAVIALYAAAAATALALDGGRRAWLVVVIAASFSAQLHASALLCAGVLFALVMMSELRRRPRHPWRAPLLGILLWAAPLVDLLNGRDANLVRIVLGDEGGDRVGVRHAIGYTARLLSPASIVRADAIEPDGPLLTGLTPLIVGIALGMLLAGVWLLRGSIRSAAIVALACLLAVAASTARFVQPPLPYVFGPMQAVAAYVVVVAIAVACALAAPSVRRALDGRGRHVPTCSASVVGMWSVALGAATVVVVASTTRPHDHESTGRLALGLDAAVERLIDRHPEWDTVRLVTADVRAAIIDAELGYALLAAGRDPRSTRPALDLPPPTEADGPTLIAAMGQRRRCLSALDLEIVVDGRVPSIGEPVTVFALERREIATDACLAGLATVG